MPPGGNNGPPARRDTGIDPADLPMKRSRLRFAVVTTFYPPYHFGGDGTYIRNLAHVLVRRGHEVEVIHDADAFRLLSKDSEPAPLPEPQGVRVHRLESRIGWLSCLATQQLGRPVVHGPAIKRILDNGRFDVIQFHNISLVGGPCVLAYGSAIKLYTAHEHWLVCPTHVLWRHNTEICTGRQCLRCVLRYRRPPQLWRQTKLLERNYRHVDAFCTLSRFSADKHREFGFSVPMTVLPSFLPERPTAESDGWPVESVRPAAHGYFLFVGRLEKIKGLQDVIPCFEGTQGPELWVVGGGNYEAELRRLADSSSRVRFLGVRTQEQLRDLYVNAIAVVTPSICYEVFPMVVLEAFREATPIVARKLGPYPEIVEQSGGGMLFESATELRAALNRLANDRKLREQYGNAGLKAFQTYWHEEPALERYFALIKDIAQRRGMTELLSRMEA